MSEFGYEQGRLDLPFVGHCTFAKAPICTDWNDIDADVAVLGVPNDMGTQWRRNGQDWVYEGIDRETGKVKYTATPVDLIFGSNSELRAVAEVYAYDNARARFVNDFVKAWAKVMTLDRFDV